MTEMVLYYIFLDLRKIYDALDRNCCLDILAGYGVGPMTLRVIWTYWSRLQMAVKAGGHYGTVFQSHNGVTWGYPFHPRSLTW